ncbi:MAG: MFS transporter [Propionibacteriaceae bacterium]|nr:MFS transporter [Propionibacteriaceae bacterium]
MNNPSPHKKNSGLRNVFFLGLISFFTDLSTEMVYPLIPLYLVSVLGATPALVGVIEGIAESLASLLKVFSGYLSDRFQKKKVIAFSGYAAGVLYKVVLLFAASWLGILGARVIDRLGKGIRTAPRDVLVSESTDQDTLGKAFGLHKMLDMVGAALGILITFFLLRSLSGEDSFNFKLLFALSIIPAILGLIMFAFVRERRDVQPLATRELFWRNLKKIDGQLKLYLVVVFLFTVGNSSNAFLLLKAHDVGFNTVNVVLLFFAFHVVASALAMPMGGLSDHVGRKKLLVPGYLVFSVCYLGFALAKTPLVMVIAFLVYGVYTAMIAGVERAYVAELAPPELKGTMLGLQSTVAGIALLPASIIAGFLWTAYGSTVPFLFGAAMSLIAAVILIVFMRPVHR